MSGYWLMHAHVTVQRRLAFLESSVFVAVSVWKRRRHGDTGAMVPKRHRSFAKDQRGFPIDPWEQTMRTSSPRGGDTWCEGRHSAEFEIENDSLGLSNEATPNPMTN
jgi:hypothetical protein